MSGLRARRPARDDLRYRAEGTRSVYVAVARTGEAVRIERDGTPRGTRKRVGTHGRAAARAFSIDATLPESRFIGPATDLMNR